MPLRHRNRRLYDQRSFVAGTCDVGVHLAMLHNVEKHGSGHFVPIGIDGSFRLIIDLDTHDSSLYSSDSFQHYSKF